MDFSLFLVQELQQQLQSSTQQLLRKEAELTRAEEIIRREQQKMKQLVHTEYFHVKCVLGFLFHWGFCVCRWGM